MTDRKKGTVIITKRGDGYVATVALGDGQVPLSNYRAGLSEFDAAATAATLMIKHIQLSEGGGVLMAPPEVLELVPEHLRAF